MASSMKQLSMATIFIFFSISLLPIHARDSSVFFSKMQRNETSQEVPRETPAIEKEEPMSFPPSSRQGYGLYGHGTSEFTTTTTTANNNNNNNDDDDKKYDNYYSGHEASSSRYVNNEYVNKGYGMSDTRFLENGKYYYDVQAERDQNGYDPLSDQNAAGYVSYNGNGNRGGNYGYGGYRSGSSTNGNAYKEDSQRVHDQNQYNNERFGNQNNNERYENQYNNKRFGNQNNNERFGNQNNNERYGNQYNSERFEDQYSNEGQEDQFNNP